MNFRWKFYLFRWPNTMKWAPPEPVLTVFENLYTTWYIQGKLKVWERLYKSLTSQYCGISILVLLTRVEECNFLVGTKSYPIFFGNGRVWGVSKSSYYLKPHQATQLFKGLKKNYDWWKLKLFISNQKEMTPANLFYYVKVWERFYELWTSQFRKTRLLELLIGVNVHFLVGSKIFHNDWKWGVWGVDPKFIS